MDLPPMIHFRDPSVKSPIAVVATQIRLHATMVAEISMDMAEMTSGRADDDLPCEHMALETSTTGLQC